MPAWNSTSRSNWRPCEAQTKRIGLCANKAHVNVGDKVYCRLHAKAMNGRLGGASDALAASALTRPPVIESLGHGGAREGAGRKPLEGRLTRCYALTPRHVEALERYRQQHQLASSSAALRHLIETRST